MKTILYHKFCVTLNIKLPEPNANIFDGISKYLLDF